MQSLDLVKSGGCRGLRAFSDLQKQDHVVVRGDREDAMNPIQVPEDYESLHQGNHGCDCLSGARELGPFVLLAQHGSYTC